MPGRGWSNVICWRLSIEPEVALSLLLILGMPGVVSWTDTISLEARSVELLGLLVLVGQLGPWGLWPDYNSGVLLKSEIWLISSIWLGDAGIEFRFDALKRAVVHVQGFFNFLHLHRHSLLRRFYLLDLCLIFRHLVG